MISHQSFKVRQFLKQSIQDPPCQFDCLATYPDWCLASHPRHQWWRTLGHDPYRKWQDVDASRFLRSGPALQSLAVARFQAGPRAAFAAAAIGQACLHTYTLPLPLSLAQQSTPPVGPVSPPEASHPFHCVWSTGKQPRTAESPDLLCRRYRLTGPCTAARSSATRTQIVFAVTNLSLRYLYCCPF